MVIRQMSLISLKELAFIVKNITILLITYVSLNHDYFKIHLVNSKLKLLHFYRNFLVFLLLLHSLDMDLFF